MRRHLDPRVCPQLASCYLPHGYWFYVFGSFPQASAHWPDDELIARYGIGISLGSREPGARRHRDRQLHYLRYERRFLC